MSTRYVAVAGFLVTLAAVLAGCAAAPRVEVVRAPGTAFGEYQTFSFHQPLGTDRNGTRTILSQRLVAASRMELENLGYRYVEHGGDLEVNFFVETREILEGRDSGVSFGYGVFHRHYGVWSGYDPVFREYVVGTLHVDVVDAGADQLVWEAVARSRRSEGDFDFDPEQAEVAAARVFADFPRRVPGG